MGARRLGVVPFRTAGAAALELFNVLNLAVMPAADEEEFRIKECIFAALARSRRPVPHDHLSRLLSVSLRADAARLGIATWSDPRGRDGTRGH